MSPILMVSNGIVSDYPNVYIYNFCNMKWCKFIVHTACTEIWEIWIKVWLMLNFGMQKAISDPY